jgi:hypothetical protein
VNPTIDLPVGEYTIELIVNDGRQDSLPDDVNVTVIGPSESFLLTYPRPIKRNAGPRKIRVLLCAPHGIEKDQVDLNKPLIAYPGGIEAIRQRVGKRRIEGVRQTTVIARFDKSELMAFVPENGTTELTVIGQLKNGEYFYGTDLVMVIERLGPGNFDYGDDDEDEDENDDYIDDGDDEDKDDDKDGDKGDDDDKDDDKDGDKNDDKDDSKDDSKDDTKDDNGQNDDDQDESDQENSDNSEWPSGVVLI